MTDMNDKDIFINAINNLPSDILSAKYEGTMPCNKMRSRTAAKSPFDETLDLHGLTKREALDVLRKTLTAARGKHNKILVITGKGNNSEKGIGVIRETIIKFLEKTGAFYVSEYRFASQRNGGDGALEIVTK